MRSRYRLLQKANSYQQVPTFRMKSHLMAKKRKLTPLEWRFTQEYNGHGDGYAAALRAGAAKSNAKQWASRILKRPDVKAAIDKKLERAAEVVAVSLGTQIARADVTSRALKLADMPPEKTNGNINGQVNALRLIAEIERFIVRQTEDLTKQLQGKTEAEKEFFALNGYWPEKEPNVDTAKSSAPGSESPGADGSKPN